MRRYHLSFRGRKIGAIGRIYRQETEVEAVDAEAACDALYDRFEHISVQSIRLVDPCPVASCNQWRHQRNAVDGTIYYDCLHDHAAHGLAPWIEEP